MFKKTSKTNFVAVLTMTLVLVLSMTVSSFAASPDDIDPQQAAFITAGFVRTSSTSATGEITADTFSTATYIKATVTLQVWVSSGVFRDVPGTSQSRTVYNDSGIYFVNYWTLENNKSYRLKVAIEDKTGTITSTSYGYSDIE